MGNFIKSLIYKYRWFFICLTFVSLFGGFFGTYVNYQTKLIVDKIASDRDVDLFALVSTFTLLVFANHIVFFFSRLLDIRYKPKILTEIVELAYTKTMKHSLHWFDSHMSGEIASKITDLQDSVITVITVLFRSLTMGFFIVIGITFLFKIHYLPAIVIITFIGVYSPIMVKLLKKQMALQKEYTNARQEAVGIINDSVANVFSIKIIGNLANEMALKLQPSIKKWASWDRKGRLYDAWYVDMADTIMGVIFHMINVLVTSYLYKSGEISAGGFGFIMITTLHIYNDIDQLLENIMFSINPKLATIESSLTFISEVNEQNLKPEIPKFKGQIDYIGVNFGYSKEKTILENLNLHIAQSEKLGIVGTSGAGKTTLIKCLLKYFPISSGSITIDGNDISNYSEESARAGISVIPQDITMFHRTILENLKIAKYDATLDEIIDACKRAKIHQDIENMPNGYETIVGERGVKLSGGQRQRIAIARAILKNAPILILDEATSALDTETEILIQKSIGELLETSKATMIVIAHRLSTLVNMDRIIVLEGGKIVEEGSHKDLLGKGGIYFKMWNSQVNGFIQ
jgi:ATP-binding cassette subfamily B protein